MTALASRSVAKQLEQDDGDDQILEVERLQEAGLNAADLKKLKESGFHTVTSVLYTMKKDLVAVKGLSDQKVEKIQEAARKMSDAGFISGTELARSRTKQFRLATGASRFDEMLAGGIESCSITEIYGEFRCGKTQICHTLAVRAQTPVAVGGGNGKVCYIDTENTFRPERIHQIAEACGIDPEQALDNIMYARCWSCEHLWQLLVACAAKMVDEPFALLIVDSIMAPFRCDYSGRGELSERQQHLAKVLNRLQKLSEEYNVAVLLTNQVMADPGGATFMQAPPKPIGGHVLSHFSTTRLGLRKGRGEQRICKLIDSPFLPESECVYEISAKGIIDAKE